MLVWGGRIRGGQDERFGQIPKSAVRSGLADGFPDSEETRQHARYIAIENWFRLMEGDATDSPGGIAADAWKFEEQIQF